jgi:hypothetical protein
VNLQCSEGVPPVTDGSTCNDMVTGTCWRWLEVLIKVLLKDSAHVAAAVPHQMVIGC